MAEEKKRIFDFGNYVTASEELAEIFFCLEKMAAVLEFSENEAVEALVEKQTAVSGYASRMKSSLSDFLEREYDTELDDVAIGSYAWKIAECLKEMKKKTFYFREKALQLPAEEIKSNLHEAARLAATLPLMVAALDAGEDEVK